MLAPYDLVLSKFELPPGIERREWQALAINETAVKERAGLYAEVGTGKTLLSTLNALFKLILEGRTTIVAMPAILIPGWLRWLRKIQGITVCDYRGLPQKRKTLNLKVNFVVMSMQIFKRDYDHLMDNFKGKKLTLIVDEATSIKNIESGNYRYTKQTVDDEDCHLQLLTGTPLNTPGDAYAYVKLIAPRIYLNHNQFNLLHVGKRDFYDKVTEWTNLPLLKENMRVNSIRLLRNDVLQIAEPIYDAIPYDLYPEHYALYKALMDAQLDLIPNKDAIDSITESKIRSRAQQLIWNYPYFANELGAKSAPYELLDEIINQLGCHERGGRKLIIFGNFKMSMAGIKAHLGKDYVGVINGDYSGKQKELYIQSFISDPRWNIILIHPESGGAGLDGLQHVCSDAIFVESPTTAIGFQQCVGRISRDGQIGTAQIRVATANKTVQVHLHSQLLTNDEQAGYVQGSFKSLRLQIYGE